MRVLLRKSMFGVAVTVVLVMGLLASSDDPTDGAWDLDVAASKFDRRQEVYVQGFPAGGPRWLVSSGGGTLARWRRDGKEIFYRALDGKLMVAPVRNVPGGLEFGTPAALFRTSEPQGQFSYPYDVSSDGQKILALVPGKAARDAASLSVIVNWDTKSKP